MDLVLLYINLLFRCEGAEFFQATLGAIGRERKEDLILCHMVDSLLSMQNSAQVAHPQENCDYH